MGEDMENTVIRLADSAKGFEELKKGIKFIGDYTKYKSIADEYSKKKIEQFILQAKELFNLTDNKITTRRIMFPVVTHTLFDTMCFYFKFD